MNKVTNWLSLTDIAHRAGVRASAVSNWRKRYADFPAASVVSGQEMFEEPVVARWLQARHIPQNRLEGDEAPGTSYGDRFLRNVEDSSLRAATNAGSEVEPVETEWTTQLWRAFDSLRAEHTRADALEILLGLVYVKLQRPALWQALVDPARWREAWHRLPDVSLSLGTGKTTVLVFRDLLGDADPSSFEAIRSLDKIDLGDGRGQESTSARASDTILAELERGMGRAGGQFTPSSVAQCLVGLLDLTSSDRLYDPFCGSGELLSAAAASVDRRQRPIDDLQVCGQASHDWSLRTSAMNLALHGIDADLRKGNALEVDPLSGTALQQGRGQPALQYAHGGADRRPVALRATSGSQCQLRVASACCLQIDS